MRTLVNIGDLITYSEDLSKVAIIESSGACYTYEDINNASNQVANWLCTNNYNPGDRIGIISSNTIHFITTYLGILKTGAVAVLLNRTMPEQQLHKIIDSSNIKLVFSEDSVNTSIKNIIFSSFDCSLHKTSFDSYIPSDTDPAIIMFTSGSTSEPKEVVLSHLNHSWIIKTKSKDPVISKRITLISAPLYHMNGLSTTETMLAGGATVVLMPKFNAQEAIKLIKDTKVNTFSGVPSMMAMMLKYNGDFTSLKQIILGSAPVSPKLINNIKKYIPSAIITVAYGLTEVGPGLFGYKDGNWRDRPDRSVGYPTPGIDYRIIDGILQVRSPSMMLRYNGDQSRITEDGFYITNDLFTVDEQGYYYFEGRADDMFVCGGHNIYPAHIESVLERHPAVSACSIIGIEDYEKGYKPYAFVVSEHPVSEDDLKSYLLSELPPSHCPRNIWFIPELPVNHVNKIDKQKLLEYAKSRYI